MVMPKSYPKQFSLYDSGLVLSSVEQLPTASASAAFTINSAKGFREDGEIARSPFYYGTSLFVMWPYAFSYADSSCPFSFVICPPHLQDTSLSAKILYIAT